MTIKEFIKSVSSIGMLEKLRRINAALKTAKMAIRVWNVRRRHHALVKELRNRKRIKVVFFLINDSVWKYDVVYDLMKKDDRFDPIIVVCPQLTIGVESMMKEMNHAYESFYSKGYNVVNSYKKTTNEWLDVKKEMRPDIVFFTNPHNLTKPEYYIYNYLDTLTCYAPYNFGNSHLMQMMHNQPFHNLLWRLFAETSIHRDYSIKYAVNKGRNVVVTGFPGTDVFLDSKYVPKEVWKRKERRLKRIIWAPHHTIDNNTNFLAYSSFLHYSNFFLDLICKYKSDIQIAFKPHPYLKYKLYEENKWGKDRTDEYYQQWVEIENGQLVIGDYQDLFLTSDAMIHDSGSFLIEYLYVNKFVVHTTRDENIVDRMNSFGKKAYKCHYIARNEVDILKYIEMVLGNNDPKRFERNEFIKQYLIPPNHKSASENITEEISKNLFHQL